MAAYMSGAHIHPTFVLCSSATRALQTYDAIAPVLGGSVELRAEDALYGAGSAELLARLQALPERVKAVLVIGHNPGMQDLAIELAGDGDAASIARLRDKFPTGALATLGTALPWATLGPGQAFLESLTAPDEL
jgi:phosphohistidine phosphatase